MHQCEESKIKTRRLFQVNNTVTHMMEEKELTATECLIFSSLISAVDPVAVLGRSLACL